MTFISGEKVSLRALSESDLNEQYLCWLNDPIVNRYSRRTAWPTSLEKMRRFLTEKRNSRIVLAMISENRHVGNIMLDNFSLVHRKSKMSILLGDTKMWKKGIGTEAWSLMTAHAFRKLNLHRIEAGTMNPAMAAMLRKLRWKMEGVQREAFWHEGSFVDIELFAILRHEWETE